MHHFFGCLIAAFMLCLLINWLAVWAQFFGRNWTRGDTKLIAEFMVEIKAPRASINTNWNDVSFHWNSPFLFFLFSSPSCSKWRSQCWRRWCNSNGIENWETPLVRRSATRCDAMLCRHFLISPEIIKKRLRFMKMIGLPKKNTEAAAACCWCHPHHHHHHWQAFPLYFLNFFQSPSQFWLWLTIRGSNRNFFDP